MEHVEHSTKDNILNSVEKPCDARGRTFAKAGHRARHMLTHTRERAFACPHCHNRYNRADVLRRHIRRHCIAMEQTMDSDRLFSSKARTRVMLACDSCHTKKIKCNGEETCSKCLSSGLVCRYERTHQRRPRPSTSSLQYEWDSSMPLLEIAKVPSDTTQDRDPDVTQQSSSSISSDLVTPLAEPSAVVPDNEGAGDHIKAPQQATQIGQPLNMWEISDVYNQNLQIHLIESFNPLSDLDFDDDEYYPAWQSLENPGIFEVDMSVGNLTPGIDVTDADHLQQSLYNLRHSESGIDGPRNFFQDPADCIWRRPMNALRYGLDLLDALIIVFRRHFSSIFISFQDLKISSQTLRAQMTAMAALGALFTDLPGSYIMARLLVNDSQRMLTDVMINGRLDSLEASTSLVHAHMCLELFGLCSGNKRSNEVGEAFHSALVQAVMEHESRVKIADPVTSNRAAHLVLFDVIILEGYRASLLQLQPILTLPHVARILSLIHGMERGTSNRPGALAEPHYPYHQLGSICALSWLATNAKQYAPGFSAIQSWRPEFIELCFRRFAETQQREPSPSMEILIFTSLLGLHAPVEKYYDLAFYMTQKGTYGDDGTIFQWLEQWQQSEDFDLALKYAAEIINQGQMIISNATIHESPHDAICVYIATLTFWISVVGRRIGNYDNEEITSFIEKGRTLLATFKVNVAKVMSQIIDLLRRK